MFCQVLFGDLFKDRLDLSLTLEKLPAPLIYFGFELTLALEQLFKFWI